VRELLNLVDTKSFKLDVHGKARLAESNGLPGYALDHLLRSNYAEFGREGAVLQLHLLLHAGRTRDFRAMIDPGQEAAMGTFHFHWLQTLLAAADGDYEEADAHLLRLIAPPHDLPDLGVRKVHTSEALALLYSQQMLNGASQYVTPPLTLESRLFFLSRLQSVAQAAHQDAELHTLRGMLALEAGALEPAQRAFRAALSVWDNAGPSATLTRHYLEMIEQK